MPSLHPSPKNPEETGGLCNYVVERGKLGDVLLKNAIYRKGVAFFRAHKSFAKRLFEAGLV